MNTLVIGPGYVGTALALALRSQNHEVSALRRGSGPDPDLTTAGIKSIRADISRAESLPKGMSFEWVINCAAPSSGMADDYRRTYFEGSRNLVSWLQGCGVEKFVYTSSTGVYGQNDGSVVNEQSSTEPESDTGKVLVATERILLDAAPAFPAIVLRLAGIYGPGRGYWLKQFLSGQARIEGDGGRILNMIHRDDVVGAIIAVLERGLAGEIYNVVDQEPVSQRTLFEWLSRKLNRPIPAAASMASQRTRGVTNKLVSSRKLQIQLGYCFKYPTFREGFDSLIE